MRDFFYAENSKSKHYFQIYDLDHNAVSEVIEEAYKSIDKWHGEKFRPDFFINICVNDEAILSSRIIKGLKNGISKIVSSAYCLITTPGRSKGTTRILGETVSKSFKIAGMTKETKNVKLLGVTYWNKRMFAPEFKYDFESNHKNGKEHSKNEESIDEELKLDKNHSHFILVKSENEPEAWFKFKDQLQNKLSEDSLTVLLALNGNQELLDSVLNSLENNIPVLLVRQTKGATDLLAKIVEKYLELGSEEQERLIENNTEDVTHFFKQFIKELKKGNFETDKFVSILKAYQKGMDESDIILISSVNFEDGDDLEIAILKAIAKANNDKSESQGKSTDIMRLALKWEKVEIGRELLNYMNDNDYYDVNEYYIQMEDSLNYNRPDFFRLFLEEFESDPNFFVNFLTSKRLYFLYNFKNEEEDVKQAPFAVLFKRKDKSFFSFKYIRNLLNELVNIELNKDFFSKNQEVAEFTTEFDLNDSLFSSYINGHYNDSDFEILANNPTIENFGPNLFIWAILFNRIEVAKIVLLKIQNQIGFCLLASILLKEFYARSNEKSFLESSEEFENYAVEILDLFDKGEDDILNYKLLQTEIKYFGRSVLQLAYSGNRQKFITTFGVQKCLLELWNNGYVENDQCRIDSDSNQLQFHRFHFKDISSFLSFGIIAPFVMYSEKSPPQKMERIKTELKILCENEEYELEDQKRDNDEEQEGQEIDDFIINNLFQPQSYLNRYKNFICSPRSHFIYETFLYLLFLFTFSYLMLCDFRYVSIKKFNQNLNNSLNKSDTNESADIEEAEISWVELLIIFWVFSFFCRMIFEILVWFEWNVWNTWNYFNVVGCLFFIIGITLRFISYLNGSQNVFIAARLTLCIDLCIWIFRSLYILMCFSNLGPKLVMIRKMLRDLFSFIAIISIFLFAYGITTHAILYPGSEINSALVNLLVDLSYWPIFGQITLLSLIENNKFPTDAKVYGYIMTTMYMFIANVLLLNLLIAMFSNTFNNVEQNAREIWVFQNFKLIFEYRLSEIEQIKLWPMPPPFNLLNFPVFFIKYFLNKKKNKKSKNKLMLQENEENYGIIVEKIKRYSEIVLEKQKK